jgi:hypothetical protein
MLHRVGIAIGPQTWFVDEFGANVSSSGIVLNNKLSGAFGYGMAITSAQNFTVQGNILVGNTSFISSRGPNCSASDPTPPGAAFIVSSVNVTTSNLQSQFQSVQDARGLTCVIAPAGGDYWPYGGIPTSTSTSSTATSTPGHGSTKHSAGAKVGLAIGIIAAVVAIIIGIIVVRRWALKRQLMKSDSRGGVHPHSVKG